MGKSLFFSSLLFLFFFSIDSDSATSPPCPIDLTYVITFPWDTSVCPDPSPSANKCCQALLTLFVIGLAQHLRDTSLFQLPDVNSSSSCLSNFSNKLAAMSIDPSLVPFCFNNPAQFVAKDSNCAGIITAEDWREKVGPITPIDTSCSGDLRGLTQCGLCRNSVNKVNSQLVGADPNATRCLNYTLSYAAGIVNEFGPKDARTASCILGLQLVGSTISKSSSEHISKDYLLKLVFGFGFFGALVGGLLALGLIIMYRKWYMGRRLNAVHKEYVSGFKASVLPNTGAKWFSLSELERATNGFSGRNLIGKGTYGAVYKGNLADDTSVAVKETLDLVNSKGDQEFSNEVEIISKIRHRNLLSLRGCCVTSDACKGKRRYLVYDFMSNGSLSDHLSGDCSRNSRLTWPQRKNIIIDVAKGLEYLHFGIKPGIYHCDIKASNILLDSEMKARVGDFGSAKQIREGQSHLTTRVAGTHGYLAPEYALYGQLTDKSDVYSFGIVVLEIMSGRKVLDRSNSSVVLITDWAWMLAKSGNMEQILDEEIREEGPKGVMERFVRVGILCAHVMVAFRPTIAAALKMLEGDIDIPRLPDRPLPLCHESFRSFLCDGSRPSSSVSNI